MEPEEEAILTDIQAEEISPPIYSDSQEYRPPRRAKYSGWSYRLLRWPLLLCISFFIFLELCTYAWVRLNVFLYEFASSTFRGRVKKNKYRSLQAAQDYHEYKQAANELDELHGRSQWKATDESPYYDSGLIEGLLKQLQKYRKENKLEKLQATLKVACKNNIGGIENEELYSHSYYGTKHLIHSFLEEVEACLELVLTTTQLSPLQKRSFFRNVYKAYGRSAFCLSGGAAMSLYHLGVVKSLISQGLLPRVISGTSGGACIAALACVRTDEELNETIQPSLDKYINPIDEPLWVMLKRLLTEGVLLDANNMKSKLKWICKGNTTFLEAYQRTGRVLNITVIPDNHTSPPTLLNYKTSPNVVIYSAVIASASIPAFFEMGELLVKNEHGILEKYHMLGKGWRDGSFKTDIPTKPLHRLFNVNYTMVSQVNPHIVLFFYEPRGSSGKPSPHRAGGGWRGGFLFSSIEHFLKLDMLKWLRFLRALDLLPMFLGTDGSFLFLQKFNGNVTIVPKPHFVDYLKLFSRVSERDMARYITLGQTYTWPKICIIQNRLRIEQMIEKCQLQLASQNGAPS